MRTFRSKSVPFCFVRRPFSVTSGVFKRTDLSTITCGPNLFMVYADGSNSLGLVIHHDPEWTCYGHSHFASVPFSPLADLFIPQADIFCLMSGPFFITCGPLPAAREDLLRLRGPLPLVVRQSSFSRFPVDIFESLSLRM